MENTTFPGNYSLRGRTILYGMSPLNLSILTGMLTFLSVVGSVGNALVIYVFSQKRDKLTSTFFILVLAYIDLMTCTVVIPFTIVIEQLNFMLYHDLPCKIYHFLITFNIPFSCFVMVAIAVDRYLCIVHPFLHAMNKTRAKVIVAVLGMMSSAMGFIVALSYGVYYTGVVSEEYNITTIENGNGNSSHLSTSFAKQNGNEEGFNHVMSARKHVTTVERNVTVVGYSGECQPNVIIISLMARRVYQKIYTSTFAISLITVAVLYVLIYHSVRLRRARRQREKDRVRVAVCTPLTTHEPEDEHSMETELASSNGSAGANGLSEKGAKAEQAHALQTTATTKKEESRKKSAGGNNPHRKDRNRIANLRTAAMLFVVTLVFIVTYLPALSMALYWIDHHPVVFYMYFANNVANPIIYSFMNKNFRDDLRRIFGCCNPR